MTRGEHGPQRVDSAERRKRIVEMRRKRYTFREIAAEMGLDLHTVWDHYQAAVKDIPALEVEAHRQEMLEQLDEAERAVLAVLHAVHVKVSASGKVVTMDGEPLVDDGPILEAARTLVALQGRKAALLGADAERKVNVSGGVRYEIVGVAMEELT